MKYNVAITGTPMAGPVDCVVMLVLIFKELFMALLLDTEGYAIPSDDECGRPLFDADLCDWNDGKGPLLTINVPRYFETEYGIYDSEGVLSVPIQKIFEQYLRDFKIEDGGDGIKTFISWLRNYADKLESESGA